jgi:hypothetical protein
LHFDEFAGAGHHHVHIYFSGGVFNVWEVEAKAVPDDANRNRPTKVVKWMRLKCAVSYESTKGVVKSNISSTY